MQAVTIHARYVTSDYDQDGGPGQLFDQDAREGTFRAYRRLLRHLRALSKKDPQLHWKVARHKLRPALQRIARNYWRDYDYDDRKRSAQVKDEARKLINPLRAVVRALDERPYYVRLVLIRKLYTQGRQNFRISMMRLWQLIDLCSKRA